MRREREITTELLASTLHGLDELGLPYAVVIKGCDEIFTNVDIAVAYDLFALHLQIKEKLRELSAERAAERKLDGIG